MNERAREQLEALHQNSGGAVQLLSAGDGQDGWSRFLVSLDTHGIASAPEGITVRSREKVVIAVRDSFPFTPPSVYVRHRRWAGTAHVQWGTTLCVYASASIEWDPSDGMRGFIARLMLWLERAAEGTLDPDGQPLHPPVAYHSAEAGTLVIHPDLGDRVPWSGDRDDPFGFLFAWCVREDDRVDVLEWIDFDEARNRVLTEGYERADSAGRPYFVASCVMLNGQIGFEYPKTANGLVEGFAQQGVDEDTLIRWIARANLVNSFLRGPDNPDDDKAPKPDPNIVLTATPSRRIEGSQLLAHISAWKLDEFGDKLATLLSDTVFGPDTDLSIKVLELVSKWLGFAQTSWMRVLEDRAEVTHRRDENTAAQYVAGKRVLLLGCGAIGAPIAEACVRAEAAALTVIDNGIVNPGILVRQAYADADIGKNKASVLADRLSRIRRDLHVDHLVGNAIVTVGDYSNIQDYDIVIDATADSGTRYAIERARTRSEQTWPDLVTVLIGHDAKRGVVAVSPSGSSGGGADILRRTAVRTRGQGADGWADVLEDLFPAKPRTDLFFPEPGCSSPTFIGAFHEVTALATMMWDAALTELTRSEALMAAVAVRLPSAPETAASVLRWEQDWVMTDQSGKFQIRVSAAAVAEIRAETRRGARVRPKKVETGGMLLGQIDEATGVVSVDAAAGPPPDSYLSAIYFDHGTAGTQQIVDYFRDLTAGATAFVGIWHTHPYGRAWPSDTDKNGMAEILSFAGGGPRAFMFILGGEDGEWEAFVDDDAQPALYAEVVERSAAQTQQLGRSSYPSRVIFYPGGYGYQHQAVVPSRRKGRRR